MDKPRKEPIVGALLGLRPTKGDLGLEIEMEGNSLPRTDALAKWFEFERDGSLRGADNIEYVLRGVKSLSDIKTALDVLDKTLSESPYEMLPSFRAGVHCHVNCQTMTVRELITFAVAYYVLEEVLVDWCGPDRVGNHFCLRAKDADVIIESIVSTLETRNLRHLNTDNLRYAALNFRSLFRYGSLEFRAMETCRDMSRIYDWCAMLLHIKEMSRLFKEPSEIVATFSNDGVYTFVRRFLGPFADKFEDTPELERKLWNGIRIAQEIAYIKFWDYDPNLNIFKSEVLI